MYITYIKVTTKAGKEKIFKFKGFADDIFVGDIINVDDRNYKVIDKWTEKA